MFCIAAVMLALLATSGCHQPAGPILQGLEPPLVWPAPPEPPRIRFLGELHSSADLRPARGTLQRLADAIAGEQEPLPLYGPRAVVVTGSGDGVWVADPGGRCVHRFDLGTRQYLKITTLETGPLLSPSGLAAGPDGTIYLLDSEAAAIFQLSAENGDLVATLQPLDTLDRPVALCHLRTTGELWVVDTAAHDVKVLSESGSLLRVLGRRGSAHGEFNFPVNITATADEQRIWIVDAGNHRVQSFTPAGEFVAAFGRPGDAPGDLALPKAVATDHDDNVYVLDARFENLQVFSPRGDLLLVLGGEGIKPGEFWLPAGVHIDGRQRLWICDSYNRRIQVFEKLEGPNDAQ